MDEASLRKESKNGGAKTMRKIIAVTLALLLMLALAGCSKNEPTTTTTEKETSTTESVDTVEEEEEASAETEDTDASTASEESDDASDSGLLSPEFKQTMDDYEAWFDHYCEVMKKYEENPSDLELLSEMTDLLTEETAMLEEMENMDQSEMNAAELAYYIDVTARIEKKLLEVAY